MSTHDQDEAAADRAFEDQADRAADPAPIRPLTAYELIKALRACDPGVTFTGPNVNGEGETLTDDRAHEQSNPDGWPRP